MFITSWTIDIRMNIQIWLLYRRYKSEWYNFWWATIQDIVACACKVWTLFGQACGQEECSQTTTDKSWLHRLVTDILMWAKKQITPPGSNIWWPRGVLHKVILTFWRIPLTMDWPGRCTPLGQTSGGPEEYYIRSSWHSEEYHWQCIGQVGIPPW